MGTGNAEKGEKGPAIASNDPNGDVMLPARARRPALAHHHVQMARFKPNVGFGMRAYLRLEAVGLSLAENWRDDCERRNARFLWCALAMAMGAAAYYSLPDEPSLLVLLCLLVAAGLWAWIRARKGAVDFILLLVASGLFGLTVASYQGQFSSTPILQRALSSPVTGVIDHIDYRQQKGRKDERWTLRVESIERLGPAQWPKRLLLVRKSLGERFKVGERVNLWARLQPLSQPAYPGGFDYARYLWVRSIGGQGYMGRKIERLPAHDVDGLSRFWLQAGHFVEMMRTEIAEQISARIDGEAGGLAIALSVGKRDYLADDVKDALRQSGLAHILAISGLHMALVAMSIFWGARALLALVPALALHFPIKQWAAAIALGCAAGYLLLSGGSVATIRAFLMTAIFLVAIILGRPALTMHNFALALIVVIVLQPYSMVEAGMQMSFAATAALIASYDRLRVMRVEWAVKRESEFSLKPRRFSRIGGLVQHVVRWIGGIGATSLTAGIAVLPFSIVHFQQLAPLGLLANLMVMPIVTLVVMPLGLISVLLVPIGLQSLTLPLVGWGLEMVIASARWVRAQSDADLLVVGGQGLELWLFVLALAAFAIHRRRLAWFGLLPIAVCFVSWSLVVPADLWISGNGARVAFRGADHKWHLLGSRRLTLDYAALLRFDGDARLVEAERGEASDLAKTAGEAKDSTRGVAEVQVPRQATGCDKTACYATNLAQANGRSTGLSVGLVRQAAAFNEVCMSRDIVVSKLPLPEICRATRYQIGPDHLKDGGARFVWFEKRESVTGDSGSNERRSDGDSAVVVAAESGDWSILDVASFTAGRRPWVAGETHSLPKK